MLFVFAVKQVLIKKLIAWQFLVALVPRQMSKHNLSEVFTILTMGILFVKFVQSAILILSTFCQIQSMAKVS